MSEDINKNKWEIQSEHNKGPDLFSIVEETLENTANILEAKIIEAMKQDPSIVDALHKALGVIQKDKKNSIDHPRNREFAPYTVPLKDIATDVKNFQNRRKPYSEYSAQGIVDAVKRWEFKWEMFNPALLRRGSDWILYVLAGHSRHEAFKRLSTTYKDDLDVQTYCKQHNCDFNNLPSLILNDINFEDARMVALMSNALATAETDVERSDVYRHMRIMGKEKKHIEEFWKTCEKNNRSRIRALSYLASNGLAMDTLYAFETGEESNHVIKKVTHRIGELRRRTPEVSNVHENELFKRLLNAWVYGKNKNKWEIHTKEDFIDIIQRHIQQLKIHDEFSPEKLLNMDKIKDISYVMKYYYGTLSAYRTRKNALMKEFHASRRKISKLKTMTSVTEETRSIFNSLEEKLKISLKAINKVEDVSMATDLLFDAVEVCLTPDEEIARCEKLQTAILEEIKRIEVEYYKHRDKKDMFQDMSKTVKTMDFTIGEE